MGLGALLFFMAMLVCKHAQEEQERKAEEDKKFINYNPEEPSNEENQ